jgi:hypothetical protein
VRRPLNTGPTEVFEAHLDSSVTPTQGRKEVYAQASDCGKIGKTAGPARKHREPLFRCRLCAGQELTRGLVKLQREGKLVLPLPTVRGQQSASGAEVL